MIYDKLENLGLYSCLGEKMEMAIHYLLNTDFTHMKAGKYELMGKDVYAIVNEYQTKPIDEVKWEAHKIYADIQFVVSGAEKMGFSSLDKVQTTDTYFEEKDIEFFSGEGNYVNVAAGEICIFFPHDVHRPSIAIENPIAVKKIVIKVKV